MRTRFLAIAALSWLAAHCGGSDHDADPAAALPAVPVQVEKARLSAQPRTLNLTGTVEARTSASLSSRVMAQVSQVSINVGDRVGKGQVLLRLDSRELSAGLQSAAAAREQSEYGIREARQTLEAARAALEAAQANAQLAESTFQRFQVLHQRGSVSDQEFDEVRSRRDASQAERRRAAAMLESIRARQQQAEEAERRARAQYQQAETTLGYTEIRAPFAGIVTAKQVELGDLASPGLPLLKLESLEGFRLVADLPESLVGKVSLGQTLEVRVDALERELQGQVVEIQPAADPASRSFRIKIELPEGPGMRSGLFGRLSLPTGQDEVLSVPSSAVRRQGQLTGVFIVGPGGAARFRLVEVGAPIGSHQEILSGLSPGDLVVLDPPRELRDGSPVSVAAQPEVQR